MPRSPPKRRVNLPNRRRRVNMTNYKGYDIDIYFGMISIYQNYKDDICFVTSFIENPVKGFFLEWTCKNNERTLNYPKDFWIQFSKCIQRSQRFVGVPVMMDFGRGCDNKHDGSHMNILIYDKNTKILERFEPNGITVDFDNLTLDSVLKDDFESFDSEIIYERPLDYCPYDSLQVIQATRFPETPYDPAGFCAAWSLWYLELRLRNPDAPPKELIDSTISTLVDSKTNMLKYIRSYSEHFVKMRQYVLNKLPIQIKDSDINKYFVDGSSIDPEKEELLLKTLHDLLPIFPITFWDRIKRRFGGGAIFPVDMEIDTNRDSNHTLMHQPPLLRSPTGLFYKDELSKRNAFIYFMKHDIQNIIFSSLKTLMDILYNDFDRNSKAIMWIGGGMAWEKTISNSRTLSQLEKSAFESGNFDVFIMCSSPTVMNQITRSVCKELQTLKDNIQTYLDSEYKDSKFSVSYESIGVNERCELSDAYDGVLYPDSAYSQMLEVKQKKETLILPFKRKELIYVETFFVDNVDIKRFENTYLTTQHYPGFYLLNCLGLYTFSKYIISDRRNKGFDVDRYRQDVILRDAARNDGCENLYERAFSAYGNVFGLSNIGNKKYVADLLKEQMITATIQDNFGRDYQTLIDDFHRWIMENMRGTLNAAIVSIDTQVMSHHAAIFLVGGDAMRRYDKTISDTKDIDAKVMIQQNHYNRQLSSIIDIIEKELSKTVVYLLHNKDRMFPHNSSQHNFGNMNVTIKHNVPTSLQYRLRYIKRGDGFPHLFSLDYRYFIEITSERGEVILSKKTELPILDITIMKTQDNKSPQTNLTRFDTVPVANLNFLIDDIYSTYSDFNKANMRSWGRKRTKDASRLQILSGRDGLDPRAYDLNTINHDYKQYFQDGRDSLAVSRISSYTYYLMWRNKYQNTQKQKIKLPFGYNDLIEWYPGNIPSY